eukprot:203945_1
MASNRHMIPSPRIVDDSPSDGATSVCGTPPPSKKKKVAGSAVQCLEYATTTTKAAVAISPFPNKQTTHSVISQCANHFLHDVLRKTLIMTEYCHRMTIHTSDVERALELFVEVDAEGLWYRSFPTGRVAEYDDMGYLMNRVKMNGDGDGEGGEEDEDWQDGKHEEGVVVVDDDDSLNDDGSDNDDKYNGNMVCRFDAVYPPVANDIQHLSDKEFRDQLYQPILEEFRSCLRCKKGVEGMLKRAMYAFLVAKLS